MTIIDAGRRGRSNRPGRVPAIETDHRSRPMDQSDVLVGEARNNPLEHRERRVLNSSFY